MTRSVSLAAATIVAVGFPGMARSQSAHCAVLCAPTLSFMPAALRSHLAGGPRVQSLATGVEQRLPSSTNLELIFAVGAATRVPRLNVYGSVQWLPNASEARNPFTLYTASDLGTGIKANAATVSAGVSLTAVPAQQTGGWIDVAANVGDLFSQAARPNDRSAYTHKLDLELVTHLHAFAHAPAQTYLHRVTLFAILDYVATGLPRAGDEVPKGRLFLTHARPLALIAGLDLPLTPEIK